MVFRQTYSRIDNSPEAASESSLEMVIIIAGQRMGRAQGLRRTGRTNIRPVNELGSDRPVELMQGIKAFQGTLQSVSIKYGDLSRRLASLSGGVIDPDSKAATLTNMPEFNIQVMRRGLPQYATPQLYAAPGSSQQLAGTGKLVTTLIGCAIESFEVAYNVNDVVIMESVSLQYIDEITSPDKNVDKLPVNKAIQSI